MYKLEVNPAHRNMPIFSFDPIPITGLSTTLYVGAFSTQTTGVWIGKQPNRLLPNLNHVCITKSHFASSKWSHP